MDPRFQQQSPQPAPPAWPPQEQQPATPAPPPPPPGRTRDQDGSRLRDFIAFRTMITPGLITIIWVIGFVVITIGSVLVIGQGESIGTDIIVAFVIWLVANLYLRVILELMIVLFRIYGRLGEVERNTRRD